MADTVNPADVFTASDSYTSDESPAAIVDDSPCYALLEFPDCFYRVQTLKLVLGRDPAEDYTYDQRIIVSDQKPPNPRKRKRSDSIEDEDSFHSDSPLQAALVPQDIGYENCATSIGGLGGPQGTSDGHESDEVFIAIHPEIDEYGSFRDNAISKKHLRIIFSDEYGWHMEVLGRNGVFMNEEHHGKGEQVMLEDKDMLTVMGLSFKWHTTSPDDDDDDSDLSSIASNESDDSLAMSDIRPEAVVQPTLRDHVMDIDEDEDEDDDVDETSEEEVALAKARVHKIKKKKIEQKQKEKPLSLKLKLKIPKAKPDKDKASKAPRVERVEKVDKPSKDKAEKVEKTDKAEKVAGKKPKAAEAQKAVKSVAQAEPAAPAAAPGDVVPDVVESVEKPDGDVATPATPGNEATNPALTPQAGLRDPVLAGLEPPPKRRGPGRPPADGIMSKRERRERQKAEAAGIPYGDPLPFSKPKSDKPEGENGEKPKKKIKREASGVGADGLEEGADADKDEPSPPAVPRAPSPKESDYPPERLVKPEETYQVLLYQVLSKATAPLALPQVYEAIKNEWPYFRFKVNGTGWESSVRHNLQSSKYFKKAGKAGKGHLWAIDPEEPFEHKAKRASPPHQAPYQAPRPYQYPNGAPMAARPPGAQAYQGYYAGQAPNGQRPGAPPGQPPYGGNFYNNVGPNGARPMNGQQPGAIQNRPPGPGYAPGPNGIRSGQQNIFGQNGTASPATGTPAPVRNVAFEQVLQGIVPDVFVKFQEQLKKISQPGPDGKSPAVEQAEEAIKWILSNPRSDEGLEKAHNHLQHMVKVLRTLLQQVGPQPQQPQARPPPPAGGANASIPPPSAQPINRAQSGTPGMQMPNGPVPPRPLDQPGVGPVPPPLATNFPAQMGQAPPHGTPTTTSVVPPPPAAPAAPAQGSQVPITNGGSPAQAQAQAPRPVATAGAPGPITPLQNASTPVVGGQVSTPAMPTSQGFGGGEASKLGVLPSNTTPVSAPTNGSTTLTPAPMPPQPSAGLAPTSQPVTPAATAPPPTTSATTLASTSAAPSTTAAHAQSGAVDTMQATQQAPTAPAVRAPSASPITPALSPQLQPQPPPPAQTA